MRPEPAPPEKRSRPLELSQGGTRDRRRGSRIAVSVRKSLEWSLPNRGIQPSKLYSDVLGTRTTSRETICVDVRTKTYVGGMTDTAVSTVDAGPKRIAKRAEVNATPHEIFALVADPRRHGELDGSGTVHSTVSGPERLHEGAKFSVNMRQLGVPYRITSTVVDFAADRVIEWRHPFGHTWRWELSESEPGRTAVTEMFDYSGAKLGKMFELSGRLNKNAAGIEETLRRLRQRFAN